MKQADPQQKHQEESNHMTTSSTEPMVSSITYNIVKFPRFFWKLTIIKLILYF